MSNYSSIDIHAGIYSWHYEPAEVPGLPTGALGDVLAGLKVETNYTDDHPLQGIPNPGTASFDVLLGDFAEIADLKIGHEVAIRCWAGEPYEVIAVDPTDGVTPAQYRWELIHWLGRVAELSATPDTHNGEPVVRVHVECVDRLADLLSLTVGNGAWPEEHIADRWTRIFETEAKLPTNYYATTWYGTAAARAAGDPLPMLEAIQAVNESSAATEHTMQVWYNPRFNYAVAGTEFPVTLNPATDKFVPANLAAIGDLAVGDFVNVLGDPVGAAIPTWLQNGGLRRIYYDTWSAKVLTIDGAGGIQLTPAFGVGAGSPIDVQEAATGLYLASGNGPGQTLDYLWPAEPYVLSQTFKRPVKGNTNTPRDLPLVLVDEGAGLVPVVDRLVDELVIPAGMCELGTQWRKGKDLRVDRVVATAKGGATEAVQTANAVPVEYTIETELKDSPILAAYRLLPETAEDGWALDTVTILDLPADVQVPWFHSRYARDTQRFPVVIDGLVETVNPNRQRWFAGMFRNGSIEFGEDGRWSITAELSSDIARPMVYSDAFPWFTQADPSELYAPGNEPFMSARKLVGSPLAAMRCSDFEPAVTAYDIRLVRRPD